MIEALEAQDRIEALRAKRDAAEEEEYQRGREDGVNIVVQLVEWSDLVIGERLEDDLGSFDNDDFAGNALAEYRDAESDLIEQYELHRASSAYVRGFVEGLAELKAQV